MLNSVEQLKNLNKSGQINGLTMMAMNMMMQDNSLRITNKY